MSVSRRAYRTMLLCELVALLYLSAQGVSDGSLRPQADCKKKKRAGVQACISLDRCAAIAIVSLTEIEFAHG